MSRRVILPSFARRPWAVAAIFFLLAGRWVAAQAPPSAAVVDEQRRFLDVRHRQVQLRAARTDLARAEGLFAQQLLALGDLERARVAVEMAQLNYQEAVLTLLGQQPRLSVLSAVKRQTRDGRTFVRLAVENLTPRFDDSQLQLLNNFEGADPIPESLRTRDVHDVFISLKSAGETPLTGQPVPRGTTIGLPYEVHVDALKYGAARSLEFQLLRDVNSVIVATTYKGQTQDIDIQLQQAATEDTVNLTSTQISQEADLAGQATFDLRLDRSTVDVRRFELKIVNLPHQISGSFVDANQARLSQLSFPSGVTQQALGLKLFLPERADEQVRMDEPLEFWVLVMDEAQAQKFREERVYSAGEIETSRAGRVKLVVIPRGAGKIEVSAPTLSSEIAPSESVTATISLKNTGTRRLDNIKLSAESPLDWTAEMVPNIVPALDINREMAVRLTITPPAGVSVGDYEVRIKSESFAFNRRVPSEDKIYRVSVKAGTNVWGMLLLVGGLVALIAGLVVFGLRLARR
jgi:NPCBM-associated, NEW3 domain of alpha-galactosidase